MEPAIHLASQKVKAFTPYLRDGGNPGGQHQGRTHLKRSVCWEVSLKRTQDTRNGSMLGFTKQALRPPFRLILLCHTPLVVAATTSISTPLAKADQHPCQLTLLSRAGAFTPGVSILFEWTYRSTLPPPPSRRPCGKHSVLELVAKSFPKNNRSNLTGLIFHFAEYVTRTHWWWHRMISSLYASPYDITE